MPLTPGQAAAALVDLPIAETLAAALSEQSERLAEAVVASLAIPAGGPHEEPWRETGSLQSSISRTAEALVAQIGSNDPAAAAQELGTATVPPRPFLAPTAAAMAESIARGIGQTIADLVARRLR